MAITTTVRVSLPWAKGPARFQDGQIVMQIDAYAPKYSVDSAQGIDVELSQIQTPDDAIAFVQRFGLLARGVYWPESTYIDGPHDVIADADIPVEDAEPYDLFANTAAELRSVLWTMKTVRAAMNEDEGATRARAELAEWVHTSWPRRTGFAAAEEDARLARTVADRDFLKSVSTHVAVLLTNGIDQERSERGATRLGISGPQWPITDPREAPDRIQLSLYPSTLRALCYWTLAEKLITRAPIVTCPGCGHDFIRAHRAQTFCTRNCTRRARYRAAQQEQGTVTAEGRR